MLMSSSSAMTLFSTNYKPYGDQYGWSGTATFTYTGKLTGFCNRPVLLRSQMVRPCIGKVHDGGRVQGLPESATLAEQIHLCVRRPMKYVIPTGFYSVTTTFYYYELTLLQTEYGFELSATEEEITTTTEYTFECTSRYTCGYVRTSSTSTTVVVGTEVTVISASEEKTIRSDLIWGLNAAGAIAVSDGLIIGGILVFGLAPVAGPLAPLAILAGVLALYGGGEAGIYSATTPDPTPGGASKAAGEGFVEGASEAEQYGEEALQDCSSSPICADILGALI